MRGGQNRDLGDRKSGLGKSQLENREKTSWLRGECENDIIVADKIGIAILGENLSRGKFFIGKL